jgi:hypothetical protein
MSTQRGESPLITGNGVIEPTGHIQAIDIAVPGAAPPVTAYRLYSVDLDELGRLKDYPTFWKVKAVLIFHARPAVRAPICVCM